MQLRNALLLMTFVLGSSATSRAELEIGLYLGLDGAKQYFHQDEAQQWSSSPPYLLFAESFPIRMKLRLGMDDDAAGDMLRTRRSEPRVVALPPDGWWNHLTWSGVSDIACHAQGDANRTIAPTQLIEGAPWILAECEIRALSRGEHVIRATLDLPPHADLPRSVQSGALHVVVRAGNEDVRTNYRYRETLSWKAYSAGRVDEWLRLQRELLAERPSAVGYSKLAQTALYKVPHSLTAQFAAEARRLLEESCAREGAAAAEAATRCKGAEAAYSLQLHAFERLVRLIDAHPELSLGVGEWSAGLEFTLTGPHGDYRCQTIDEEALARFLSGQLTK